MKHTPLILLSLTAFLLAGCSSTKVKSKTVSEFDFSRVQTYEWIQAPVKILEEDDTFLSENVQTALNNELAGRSWKQVLITDKADIQIVYYIKLAEQQEYAGPAGSREDSQLTGGFTYNSGKGTWGYYDEQSDLNVYTIEIGTLTLLIYDARSGEKIWEGSLETRLDRSTPVEKRKAMLAKIAHKIISRIP